MAYKHVPARGSHVVPHGPPSDNVGLTKWFPDLVLGVVSRDLILRGGVPGGGGGGGALPL